MALCDWWCEMDGKIQPVDAMPEEARLLVQMIIEGRVKQFAIIIEDENGCFLDKFPVLDDSASRMGMIGALEVLKRDYMRIFAASRVEYVEREDLEE